MLIGGAKTNTLLVPMIELAKIDREILQTVTPQQAWHYSIIPFEKEASLVSFYIDESKINQNFEDELELLLGKAVALHPLDSQLIQRALNDCYRSTRKNGYSEVTKAETESSSDFLVNLIRESQQLQSSDIHIEPYEHTCRIRFRIDGELIERYQIDKKDYPGLVNKIKIKANLDIAEKRLPQDGRIFFEEEGSSKFDIRVSILPTLYGEKVVMRLLGKDTESIDLHQLGLSEKQIEDYMEGISSPSGIVLISGPTGSGKTTTLYATLKLLNKTSKNILTIEDPIEYTLDGVNQVQLKESIGLNFGKVLRTFLRQDPNIIMVGEIRDQDTASAAIRLSQTGHLVLSTVHTNSAWGIVSRLVYMGVPAYLLADTLNLAIAQRLVRLLCPDCKKTRSLDQGELPRKFKPSRQINSCFDPVGCDACFYTGYRGRRAVFEIIPIDNELSEKIKNEEFNVGALLEEKKIKKLSSQAFELLADGATSLEEVYPILASRS